MTTPTIEELWKRKSVRAYTDRKITKEEKELILRSASEAKPADVHHPGYYGSEA